MSQKIVLIEDDEVLAKVIFEELTEAEFDVHKALDGESGLKLVQSEKPDLVLLDLILPQKHGFDVLEELKKSPATSAIPVIILTMLGRDDDIKKGLRLGANDYIVKSQHAVAEIVEKIQKFFGKEAHPKAKEGAALQGEPRQMREEREEQKQVVEETKEEEQL